MEGEDVLSMKTKCNMCGVEIFVDDLPMQPAAGSCPTKLGTRDRSEDDPVNKPLNSMLARAMENIAKNGLMCEACFKKHQRTARMEALIPVQAQAHQTLRLLIPPEFLLTKMTHPKMRTAQALRAMSWRYGPKGLLLAGGSGEAKSRCAYKILEREHLAGRRCIQMTAVEFATRLPKEPITWLDAARDCDLLLIDDLGKARLTYQDHEATRATECMFDLVDYRGKNHLPMIITTQLEDQELIAKWGENGVAFVRRLLEFCDIVAFPRK